MTDTSSVAFATHAQHTFPPVTAPSLQQSPVVNGSLSDSVPAEEDEPYTIKCICAYRDDDGNTVFCERCETWQHIDCYYHGKEVPDIHNCVDCEPRSYDARKAQDRQNARRLRELNDGGDRKTNKRPASKSHKKKPKEPTTEQVNGTGHQRHGSSVGRDQPPPAKRPKTNHRSSNSVHATPVLQPDARKRASSASSPVKSPLANHQSQSPLYTQEFLTLYDQDKGLVDMKNNIFENISLAGDLASWLQDPSLLSRASGGKLAPDVFTHVEPDFLQRTPLVSRITKTDNSVSFDGRYPKWQYIRTDSSIRKDDIVGEVKGRIGHLRDYSLDPKNRWKVIRHPDPFVFFHPQLPIYIDSREEGTEFRYVRRSCRPNLKLRTIITNETEFHFCFQAIQDIPAGTELTALWYTDPMLFGNLSNGSNGNGLVKEEDDPVMNTNRADWASRVLANFGGCACSGPQPCLLANFDHRQRPQSMNPKAAAKRKRTKSKAVASPPGTGQAVNSRAGSEAIKAPEDDDGLETRSATGSSRGQPKSRDLTPVANQEALLKVGTSAREQRKIAAVESRFQMLEHDQPPEKKQKKKRSSTGSTAAQPKGSKQYVDASTSRHGSGSPTMRPTHRKTSGSVRKVSQPNTPRVHSPLTKPTYVDAQVQTEPEEPGLDFVPPPVSRPRPIMTLTQRLLKRCHDDRRKSIEELEKRSPSIPVSPDNAKPHPSPSATPATPIAMEIPPLAASPKPSEKLDEPMEEVKEEATLDVEMEDATPALEAVPSDTEKVEKEKTPLTPESDSAFKPPPPPWPSTAAHSPTLPRHDVSNGFRSTGLRVEMPSESLKDEGSPPAQVGTPGSQSSLSHSPGPITSTASTSASSTALPPPLAPLAVPVVAPSPIKKKLSLGDYMRRNNLTTPTTEKAEGNAMQPIPTLQSSPSAPIGETMVKPSEGVIAEAQARGGLEGSAIDDNPSKQSSTEPPTAAKESDAAAADKLAETSTQEKEAAEVTQLTTGSPAS